MSEYGRSVLLGLLAVLGAVFVIAGIARGREALRQASAFKIEDVEVRGANLLAADSVIRLAGLTPAASVFDPTEAYRKRLLRHPLIRDAEFDRRIPRRLIIAITERAPVAYAATNGKMEVVDGEGYVLPIPPSSFTASLPIMLGTTVNSGGERLTEPGRDAAAVLAALTRIAPEWSRSTTSVRSVSGGVSLQMDDFPFPVFLPLNLNATVTSKGREAIRLIERNGWGGRVNRLDLRFDGQVVMGMD